MYPGTRCTIGYSRLSSQTQVFSITDPIPTMIGHNGRGRTRRQGRNITAKTKPNIGARESMVKPVEHILIKMHDGSTI